MLEPPILPGAGRFKAARLVRESRRRAGLRKVQLATLAAVPRRTVLRIESGEVVPRIDTVERLLLACGKTLAAEPRWAAREDAPSEPRVEVRAFRALRYLAGAGVEHVVIGAMAASMYGAAAHVTRVDILIPDSERERRKLLRALRAIDRRWSRVESP